MLLTTSQQNAKQNHNETEHLRGEYISHSRCTVIKYITHYKHFYLTRGKPQILHERNLIIHQIGALKLYWVPNITRYLIFLTLWVAFFMKKSP